MPRVVKKIKKERKPFKPTKKFWILLTSIILGVIAIGVTIGLIVYFVTKEDDYDYFSAIPDEYSITYDQAKKEIENDENLFIFYWDKTLDPEDSTADAEKEANIEKLYKRIEAYNALDASSLNENSKTDQYQEISFYLVYTGNAKGKGALGTTSTNDDGESTSTANAISGITSTNSLAYYYGGKYNEYAFDYTEETEEYDYTMTDVKEAINFVNKLYNDLAEKINK